MQRRIQTRSLSSSRSKASSRKRSSLELQKRWSLLEWLYKLGLSYEFSEQFTAVAAKKGKD